jgi:hypothetical protein
MPEPSIGVSEVTFTSDGGVFGEARLGVTKSYIPKGEMQVG